MYEAKQHKAAVSHKFSVTEKKSVHQLRMNDNRERSVPQKNVYRETSQYPHFSLLKMRLA